MQRPGQVGARDAVRPRQEIEAGLAHVRDDRAWKLSLPPNSERRDPEDTYTLGKITALEWVLGTAELTPLTCRPGVDGADPREIEREAVYATDMLYGRHGLDRRGRSFVVGVEETLMWVRYQATSDEL